MAILLTGSGGLFTRLGKLVGALNDVNTFRGGTSSGQLVKAVTDALAQVDGDTALVRNTLAGLQTALASGQNGLTTVPQAVRTAAQNLLITMANNDTPLVQQTTAYALALLKTQMLAGGYYVNPNTVSAAVTPGGSNTGNGAVICGTRDKYGYQLDNLLAETISVSCTAESAAAGSLSFRGAAVQGDPLNWQWPAGSGCNQTLASLDPANAGLVSGGNFDSMPGNIPAGWTVATGTAGTDFQASGSGAAYKGANAFEFLGGTSALTSITQALTLAARTPYALCLWLKETGSPATGVLQIDLYNGSSVIQDEAGNNCSLAINLSSLTTSYVAHSAVWQIADPLPASVTLRVHLTTACPAAANVYLDQLTLQPATQLGQYAGDTIFAAVATGSVDWCLRDTLSIATSNNRTCQWQQAFDRLFQDRQAGFVLPTSGSTLINDSLISD